tara:strand:+ start:1081 stop:1911 length:831 start_codon:yes stop_codon:yes gene_type:complete
MGESNIIHFSTINMDWCDDPGIPGFKQKILKEDKSTGAVVRLWFVPPDWGDEVFNGKPDRHYHKTVVERGFHLHGDFPHWEFDSVDDFEGTLYVFKPGLFMDRPTKSLHGLHPDPRSQAGAQILYWSSGSGASVKDPDFNEETVNVPFQKGFDAGEENFSQCKFTDTRNISWDNHPVINNWKIKKLSPESSLVDQVNLVFIPSDWTPLGKEQSILTKSKNPWLYIIAGDMRLKNDSSIYTLKSDDFLSWDASNKVLYSDELFTETGCTILCSGHLM